MNTYCEASQWILMNATAEKRLAFVSKWSKRAELYWLRDTAMQARLSWPRWHKSRSHFYHYAAMWFPTRRATVSSAYNFDECPEFPFNASMISRSGRLRRLLISMHARVRSLSTRNQKCVTWSWKVCIWAWSSFFSVVISEHKGRDLGLWPL